MVFGSLNLAIRAGFEVGEPGWGGQRERRWSNARGQKRVIQAWPKAGGLPQYKEMVTVEE